MINWYMQCQRFLGDNNQNSFSDSQQMWGGLNGVNTNCHSPGGTSTNGVYISAGLPVWITDFARQEGSGFRLAASAGNGEPFQHQLVEISEREMLGSELNPGAHVGEPTGELLVSRPEM